ncbi:MAG: Coenzyme F420 hydrogenase/dehydrogenase, beta subunit C-terminal domain [Thermodesulfobacteriota bacterium]|nr:Coenzyme F420 hydrogenase/dehydrogenase, beta subunit C-terminal domain [Thermodesulfobacteriota bacterium]
MSVFGPNELLEDVFQKDLCIGCGACTYLCPYFRSYRGKTAMLFPCTLDQGRCWAYCPKVEVDLDDLSQRFFHRPYDKDPLGFHGSVKISRAGKQVGTGSFQAGGTVSALMSFALNKGYIDAAVLTDKDGILPVPRLVTDPDDVLKCSSSKYTASPTLSALNQAIKEGHSRIGVVATPCQALAIAKMRSNPMSDEDFTDPVGLVVGLFCTWAIDFRAFDAFISKRIDVNKVTKVDIPPPPAEIMEIYTDSGKVEIPLDEIRKLVPNSCSYCIDMSAEFSDISVGVLEGRPDMNTIIVRTKRGQNIVDEAEKEGFLVLDNLPKENLEHLMWAANNKKKRALIKAKEDGLINTSQEDKRSYLRVRPETVEEIIS